MEKEDSSWSWENQQYYHAHLMNSFPAAGKNGLPLYLHESEKNAYTIDSAYFNFDFSTGEITTLKTKQCVCSGGGIHIGIDFSTVSYDVEYQENAEYYGVHYEQNKNILHFIPYKVIKSKFYFLGFLHRDMNGANLCLIPHTLNGKYFFHPKRMGRKTASFICRPVNGVTIKPTIDWKERKLIFNTESLLILTENGYFTVENSNDIYEVPFSNSAYNFLVGSNEGLYFLPASDFISATQSYSNSDIFYFGYIYEASKGFELTFEVNECKTLSVLGDSISTFSGYIPENVPDKNIFYPGVNTGVTNVHKMWWQIVCDTLGYKRNYINAYGGSRVTDTNGLPTAVERSTFLDNGTDPDIIIIYIGINDFNGGVEIGDYEGNGAIPDNLTQFSANYAKILYNVHKKYKLAKVYCMTLPPCQLTLEEIDFPECNQKGVYQYEFNEVIRKIAKAYNCGIIEGESCGITLYNGKETISDYRPSDGWFLHPNDIGQRMIAEEVIKTIS